MPRTTKTHCIHGHERTPKNTNVYGQCKTCNNIRSLEHYHRKGIETNSVKRRLDQSIVLAHLAVLTSREVEIIKYRYGLYDETFWTLQRVATELGVTKERIRQIEDRAKAKIWNKVREEQNDEQS